MNVQTFRFSHAPPHLPTADRFVTVENFDGPLARVDLYRAREEQHAFEEAIGWHGLLAIGWGHHAYFVHLATCVSTELNLDRYFSRFYPTESLLLIASAEQIFAVDSLGNLTWRSKLKGRDGVVIDRIEKAEIHGHGEWDPPEWQPFRLDLHTGCLL